METVTVAAETAEVTAELARLTAERDDLLGLVERLRAERAAGEIDPADADALEDDATARAAEVLRRIKELQSGTPAPSAASRRPSPTVAPAKASRGSRTWWWAAGLVVFVVVAGLLVAQAAGQRGIGDTFTGDTRQTTRDLLLDARQQMAAGEFDAALATFDQVLVLSPANAEALTYRAWVGRTMARSLADDEALALLDDAVASDPAYGDARVFAAIILRDLGRFDEALAQLDAVADGAVPEFMAGQVEALRAELVDPDRALVARAGALVRDGDPSRALRLLDEVLARNPNDLGALLSNASILAQVAAGASGADRDVLNTSALDLLVRANRVSPDDPVPLLYRAQLLAGQGRVAESRAVLDQLDALAPLPAAVANEAATLRNRLGA
jgi:tetratricopeptide (TPR) repeat protein